MASVEFKINRSQLKAFAGSRDVETAMQRVALFVEGSAKRHAPVRTGNLRRSITHEVERDSTSWVARIGTNVKYGIFQEVGTVNHPAHPFLRPALDELRRGLRGGEI